MSKHFEVTTPRPLGHRQTVNAADKAEMDQAVDLLAEKLAPMVAKLLEGKAPATNGSNGRKLNPSDLTSPAQGDEWDTLPPGDGWSSYDMNNPPGGEPKRNPFSPTGDDFDHLPVD
jgi:hypothetical protein